MGRNPALGGWTEEETNWSKRDTARMKVIMKEEPESIPTSFEKIRKLHESLPY